VYTYEPKLVRYLCAHGRRREWDLLYAIAESEIREKEKLPQGPSRVWSTVVGNAMYEKSPYTIPFLGLALTETQQTGVRWVGNPGMAQPYSAADTAAGLLQLRTGQDLGYKMEGTADERKAAIERARAWWEKEGKAKYTFDSIEKNLLKKPDPKK